MLGTVIPKELNDLPKNVQLEIIDEITPQFSEFARTEGKLDKTYTAAISELWRSKRMDEFKAKYGDYEVDVIVKTL